MMAEHSESSEIVQVLVRFKDMDAVHLENLQKKTGLSRSDLVRRACRYSMAKFLADQVDILTLQDK